MQLRQKLLIVSLLPLLILSACAPLLRLEQPAQTENVALQEGGTIGQTFLSRYDGLEGIAVDLEIKDGASGTVQLSIYSSPVDSNAIRIVSLPIDTFTSPGYHRFNFDPLDESFLQSYYLELKVTGTGSVLLGSGPGNTYLNGALHTNRESQDAQLSFRLIFDRYSAVLGIAGEVVLWFGYLLAFIFLFLVPGWAVLTLLSPRTGIGFGEKFGLSIGIGLALYPLIYLWGDVLGIRLGGFRIWILPALSFGLILFRSRHFFSKIRIQDQFSLNTFRDWLVHPSRFVNLAIVLLLGLLVFTRFWPIRTLDAPMWGDSYQHTMISQLLVDHQGLFRSWDPYADLQSFTYHFGFHSLVAAFHWVTGLDLPGATLWTGQLLNLMAILALYPLAIKVGGNRWSGIMAVLIAGLLSPMPMFYVNWGRYTQLAGQAILPAAFLLLWDGFTEKKLSWKSQVLIWITSGGLFLTHYRVFIFLIPAYLAIIMLLPRMYGALQIVSKSALHATGTILISLPWILRLVEGRLPALYGAQVLTPASQISEATQDYNAIGELTTYLPMWLWILLIVSIVYGLWKRDRGILVVTFWWAMVILVANPGLFGLPGTGVLSNFAVLIGIYIPAGVLLGSVLGKLIQKFTIGERELRDSKTRALHRRSALISILFLALALWGARTRLSEVSPGQHALVTRPDVLAANWIRENLPADAKFLVNSFFAYGGSLVVGSDAGWWLPLLSNRATTLPPINYNSEAGPRQDYVDYVNNLVEAIDRKGVDYPDVLELLREQEVTHLFVGQRQGRVNAIGSPPLEPDDLIDNPNFAPVYHQDRVWIFEIVNHP